MGWECEVALDPDKPDVGYARATYSDPADPDFPPEQPFRYARRARISGAEAQAFKAEALAALERERTRRQRNRILSSQLTALMNE